MFAFTGNVIFNIARGTLPGAGRGQLSYSKSPEMANGHQIPGSSTITSMHDDLFHCFKSPFKMNVFTDRIDRGELKSHQELLPEIVPVGAVVGGGSLIILNDESVDRDSY
jgi:hypothetical protein